MKNGERRNKKFPSFHTGNGYELNGSDRKIESLLRSKTNRTARLIFTSSHKKIDSRLFNYRPKTIVK